MRGSSTARRSAQASLTVSPLTRGPPRPSPTPPRPPHPPPASTSHPAPSVPHQPRPTRPAATCPLSLMTLLPSLSPYKPSPLTLKKLLSIQLRVNYHEPCLLFPFVRCARCQHTPCCFCRLSTSSHDCFCILNDHHVPHILPLASCLLISFVVLPFPGLPAL